MGSPTFPGNTSRALFLEFTLRYKIRIYSIFHSIAINLFVWYFIHRAKLILQFDVTIYFNVCKICQLSFFMLSLLYRFLRFRNNVRCYERQTEELQTARRYTICSTNSKQPQISSSYQGIEIFLLCSHVLLNSIVLVFSLIVLL